MEGEEICQKTLEKFSCKGRDSSLVFKDRRQPFKCQYERATWRKTLNLRDKGEHTVEVPCVMKTESTAN